MCGVKQPDRYEFGAARSGNLWGRGWELPALHILHSVAFLTYLNSITGSLSPFTGELGVLQIIFLVPFIIFENSTASISANEQLQHCSLTQTHILCYTALSLVPCCLVCSQILEFFRLDVLGGVWRSVRNTLPSLSLYALIVHRIVCLCACEFVFWWHLSLRADN